MEATTVRKVTLATGKDWVIPGAWYTLRKKTPTTQVAGQNPLLYEDSGATIDKLVYMFHSPVLLVNGDALVGEFVLGECSRTSYVCGGACTGLISASAGVTWDNCTLAVSTSSNCVRIDYTDPYATKTGAALMVRLYAAAVYGWAFAISQSASWPDDTQYCASVQIVRNYKVATA